MVATDTARITVSRPPEGDAPALDDAHGARGSGAVLRALLVILPVVLAGYALGDRGFAYLASVPGTPLFAGEVIIALGGVFAAVATGYLRGALRAGLPMALLLVFMTWGLLRTLPFLPTYGIDAIRDASLWYYALAAVVAAMLVVAVPTLPQRWAGWYLTFAAVLLLWSPVAMLLGGVGLTLPGSGVPLFSHKPGNIAVAVATAIGFLWLVPNSLRHSTRAALTAFGTVVIFAVGTQNRGGMVAALVALVATVILLGRGSRQLAPLLVGTTLIGFVFAWGLDVHLTGGSGRDYSAVQLLNNAASIVGVQQEDTGNLGATITFRNQLWSGVIDLAAAEGALPTGLGFGPNLAQQLGVSGGAADPLRSPHNSHVDVLARMGFAGLALWAAFWVSWGALMVRRSRDRGGGIPAQSRGIIKACVVGVTGILVNSYFDPTLESPQVAIWLWTLAGLGLGIVAVDRIRGSRQPGGVVPD